MQIIKIKYAKSKFSLIRVNHPAELKEFKDLVFDGFQNLNGKRIKTYKHVSCLSEDEVY